MEGRLRALPTLIVGWGSQQRDRNAQDNEQRVPEIQWNEFPRRFAMRRTFSENEMDYFDEESGQRTPFNRSSSSLHLKILEGAKRAKKEMKPNRYLGISDEYVPGLVEFNPAKFGVVTEPPSIDEEESMNLLHAQVKPIAIAQAQADTIIPTIDNENRLQVTDEMFQVARSPERIGDRIILSSLPKEFQSFSFSERRKILNDIIPSSLKDDPSYKDHLSKIIRRNTSANTSPNISRRGSIISRRSSTKLITDPDTNQMGSTVLDSWVLGKVINKGAFGIIRECRHCSDISDIKCFKLVNFYRSPKYLHRLKRELLTWVYLTEMSKQRYLSCLVPLLDFRITKDYIFMQMPLCNEGSLFDRVKLWESSRVTLRSRIKTVIKYIYHAARAIEFIHSEDLYHGDIKLENFLLQNDIPLICDFGMANFINKTNELSFNSELIPKLFNQYQTISNEISNVNVNSKFHRGVSVPNSSSSQSPQLPMRMISNRITNTLNQSAEPKLPDNLIGSLPYAAPELLKPSPEKLDKGVDVWAFGVLCYALVMFKLPFSHSFEPRLRVMILEGHWGSKEWDDTISSVNTGHVTLQRMAKVINEIVSGCITSDNRMEISDVIRKLESFITDDIENFATL